MRVADTEGVHRDSGGAMTLPAWEAKSQSKMPSGRVEVPGYEPLRA